MLGGGGREHALAWALGRSPSVREVLVAPGNAGTAKDFENVAVAIAEPAAVVALAKERAVDLVVVGPEAPLCAGVVDALETAGILAFGPTAAAAKLEGSKAFMKRFAADNGIPTSPFLITEDIVEAERYIDGRGRAVVVKADGLAGGKGAIVTSSAEEAKAAARSMLVDGAFGEAGRCIVIEDRLEGHEMSVHVVTDGERSFILPVSRDHKRIGDGDTGPNTGGMGAFAPVAVDEARMARIQREVIEPTLAGMRQLGSPYRGVLYAGLMIAPDGTPNLLEHNVRFGDPETQVLMSLLDGDVAGLLGSAAAGELDALGGDGAGCSRRGAGPGRGGLPCLPSQGRPDRRARRGGRVCAPVPCGHPPRRRCGRHVGRASARRHGRGREPFRRSRACLRGRGVGSAGLADNSEATSLLPAEHHHPEGGNP